MYEADTAARYHGLSGLIELSDYTTMSPAKLSNMYFCKPERFYALCEIAVELIDRTDRVKCFEAATRLSDCVFCGREKPSLLHSFSGSRWHVVPICSCCKEGKIEDRQAATKWLDHVDSVGINPPADMYELAIEISKE